MSLAASLLVPVLVFAILAVGLIRGVPCFEAFKTGATDGLKTIFGLLPTLIGLMTAIGVFRASGAVSLAVSALKPFFRIGKLTEELFPLAVMRPVSGSASLAILEDIIKTCGADSFPATAACIMMGSTETILYTMSVYTGKSGIKKAPGVLPAAIFANLVSALLAVLICSRMG